MLKKNVKKIKSFDLEAKGQGCIKVKVKLYLYPLLKILKYKILTAKYTSSLFNSSDETETKSLATVKNNIKI